MIKKIQFLGNKTILVFLLLNIALIAIGFFGVLDSAGFLNAVIPSADLTTGTAEEYWKYKNDYYFSITYIAFLILNYVVIFLYKGKSEISERIAIALIMQLSIVTIIGIIKVFFFSDNPPSLGEPNISTFGIYHVVIAIIASMWVYNFKFKNKVGILLTAAACLIFSFIVNLQTNILSVDIANKSAITVKKLEKVGTPVNKYHATLFSIESTPDGVTTLDRLTNNQTNYIDFFLYISVNKPSNEEVFRMVENFYNNHISYDETYLKEKMGDNVSMTKLHVNNDMVKKYKDIDMYLINVYKKEGIDAALKAIKESKKGSMVGLLINRNI